MSVRRGRPTVPPTYFRDVFSKLYKEDFRRFLLKNRSLAPLQFLDLISEINKIQDKNFKQYKVNQVWRRFFKTDNGDALQCSDRIIDLLSTSEYVTIPFLKAAYPIVLKALEYNWFRKYEETFRQSEQSQKRPKFELLMSFKRAMRKISGSNILRKIGYLLTEIRKHGLSSTLSDYIECLYQEQLRDIQEITEEKLNRRRISHLKPRLKYLKLSEYRILKMRVDFFIEALSYKKAFQNYKKHCYLPVEKRRMKNKAQSIIKTFLSTENFTYSPLNVSPTLLSEAIMKFKREGISHGLFHNLALDVLPSIYKAWDIMHLEQNACGGREKFKAKVKLRLKVIQSDITRHNILGKNDLSSFMEGTGRNAWSVCLGVPKTWSSHACEVEHDKSTRKQHGSSPSYIL
ncbi:uncharacterized protein LOC118764206 [Octopus sinensis]|uniref:Uncharacterized protein LOC118764206 n=1 Tax=Octopus sinensis TaxID=2607531 RepID=A0A7E6EYT2_9MOLL|nr:uncharacterized protein LOC118764206 [Octopus sinensis]